MIATIFQLNNSFWTPGTITNTIESQTLRSDTAVLPAPDWYVYDSNDHFHSFDKNGGLPTLRYVPVEVPCNGLCGDHSGNCGETMVEHHFRCLICDELIIPLWVPDYNAREFGVTIPKARRTEVDLTIEYADLKLPQGTQLGDVKQFSVQARVGARQDYVHLFGVMYVDVADVTIRRDSAKVHLVLTGEELSIR